MSKIGTAPDPVRLAERAIEDGGEDMDDLEAFVETVHGDTLRVHYAERGADHITQESALRRRLDDWLHATIAIDAVGEGSGLGDRLQQAYPDVHRFKAGQTTEFKDYGRRPFTRSEVGFATVVSSTTTTSVRNYSWRHGLTFDERHLASRGADGATVLEASSKGSVKDSLGRSPDYLDAAAMATWAASGNAAATGPTKSVVRRRSGAEKGGTTTYRESADGRRRIITRSGADKGDPHPSTENDNLYFK